MGARLAEAVFTLTQFTTVHSVKVEVDGQLVADPAGAANPLTRGSFAALTPAILIENPIPGDAVSSPLTGPGSASTFEGSTSFQVLDASGRVLAEATGTGGSMGDWTPFRARLDFAPPQTATGTAFGFSRSPKDGSIIDAAGISVSFS